MSLWDAFTGKSQRDDLTNANNVANTAIGTGLYDYTKTAEDYLGKSLSYLKPEMDTGHSALKLLGDVLGLNGADAQKSFFSGFQRDPGFNATLDAGVEALDRGAAARGLSRSGGQMRSLFDFGQRHLTDAFNSRIGSLFNMAGFGSNAAANSASLTNQTGTGIADANFGAGQLRAGNAISYGNAMSASRSTPINNIIGLGTMLARFMPGSQGAQAKTGSLWPSTGTAY